MSGRGSQRRSVQLTNLRPTNTGTPGRMPMSYPDDEDRRFLIRRSKIQANLARTRDLHVRMEELKQGGLSYREVAERLTSEGKRVSWQTVRYHLQRLCICKDPLVTLQSLGLQTTK